MLKVPPHIAWPGFVLLIASISLVGAYTLVKSSRPNESFAVEADYYERALAWDEQRALERASAALGWASDVRIDVFSVEVKLVDRDAEPIADAELTGVAFHNALAGQPTSLTFVEGEAGHYIAVLDAPARAGTWTIDFRAHRGGDLYVHRGEVEVHDRDSPGRAR